MNVLQLLPKLNVCGGERGTVDLARHLILKGHKAVVVSGGGPMEKSLAAIGARHYSLPVGKKNPALVIYCYFKLRQIIKKENIDIVHARSRVPALSGYFAARATHRKFITTAHGQYKKHLISRVMGWGKIVIAANDTMARHMKDNFGVASRKIAIVPRGVDLDKFSFVPPSEKESKVFRIGMVSRFTPLKGHLDFLKAASYVSRKVHNLEIVLMGDRGSAKREYIDKIDLAVRRLMIDKIVRFESSEKDVAEVMRGLDVVVSANREQEAFGRTVIEAQARGVPVVATRVGGVMETIADGETGLLCEPGDPSDMAEKILRFAADKGLREKAAAGARRQVEENFSLKRMMDLTLEAYSRLLAEKNILVFKISSLGDVILSVPSIRAIRKRYKNAVIKVLVDVRFREVLNGCPYLDEILTCDLAGRDKGKGFLALASRLRSEDFDMSVDLQNSRKSHMLAFLAAVPERYGFDNRKWSFLLNRRIGLPRKKMGPVEHQGCVLGLMGITALEERLELWPSEDDRAWASEMLRSNWLQKDQKLVAISLSASRKWKTKNWPVQRMVEVADMLAERDSARVVLVGAGEDMPEAREFMKKVRAKPIDAVGRTGIPALAALIERCNALVTGDSAPMHVAAAVGTPFVALFGPTDPDLHLPSAGRYKMIKKRMNCSPCYKPSCFRRIKCMKAIKPEEVYGALSEIMGKEIRGRKAEVR